MDDEELSQMASTNPLYAPSTTLLGRPKGHRNKVPTSTTLPHRSGNFSRPKTPPLNKRPRGRPKGSKNKPGHKAGRPRKGQGDGDEAGGERGESPSSEPREGKRPDSSERHPLAGMRPADPSVSGTFSIRPAQPSPGVDQQSFPQLGYSSLESYAFPSSSEARGDNYPVASSSQPPSAFQLSHPEEAPIIMRNAASMGAASSAAPQYSSTAPQSMAPALAYLIRDIEQPAVPQPYQLEERQPSSLSYLPSPSTMNTSHPFPSQLEHKPHTAALQTLSDALSTRPRPDPGQFRIPIDPSLTGGFNMSNDPLGSLPRVAGPFQLIEADDHGHSHVRQMSEAAMEANPGPVYVYIAPNYEQQEQQSSYQTSLTTPNPQLPLQVDSQSAPPSPVTRPQTSTGSVPTQKTTLLVDGDSSRSPRVKEETEELIISYFEAPSRPSSAAMYRELSAASAAVAASASPAPESPNTFSPRSPLSKYRSDGPPSPFMAASTSPRIPPSSYGPLGSPTSSHPMMASSSNGSNHYHRGTVGSYGSQPLSRNLSMSPGRRPAPIQVQHHSILANHSMSSPGYISQPVLGDVATGTYDFMAPVPVSMPQLDSQAAGNAHFAGPSSLFSPGAGGGSGMGSF
ncbi:hypothetical protein T439DRAFT_324424 [Meredithblackwellia eburnea MCA 4105]